MTTLGDGVKNIFLAGIGAMAFTAEKGKELVDQLVEKGEITVDQGRQLNEELKRKTDESTSGLREGALETTMRMMTPEDREAFAAAASKFAAEQNAADAAKKAEATAEDVAEAVDEAAAE
ncbi:MAG: hypothetical protein IJ131_11490 [Eggerthellaceae bacterium]|nr:hypothetical protein [Eggerthellaceae bacterium]